MVNAIARAIPTVNTNLAGFGFGAMYPSWRQIDVAMADFRGAKRKRYVSYFTLRWCPKNARWPKTLCELATCLGVGPQDHKDRLLFRSKQLSCVVGQQQHQQQ
jgi:hypothetical protein